MEGSCRVRVLAGCETLPGARPCRVFASLPGKILPGSRPLVFYPLIIGLNVFLLILSLFPAVPRQALPGLVSSYPPAGLAAGMATTARAQVWGTKKPKL